MKHAKSYPLTLFRIIAPLGCVLAFLGGGTPVHSGYAQNSSDTSYVLDATGDEISWDDPWQIEPDVTEIGDDFEIVGFTSDTSSLLISVIPNDLDLEEARDTTLEGISGEADSFTIVDRGAYENISYALDIASYDSVALGVFTLFRGGSGQTPTFVYVFIGGISSFSEGFASAQDTFRVSGDTIFNGVDGQGLEDQLVANANGDANTPPSEEATEEIPTRDRAEPIDDEFIDLGVVENGVYESPQFGTEVLWNEDWGIDENVDSPLVSDERDNVDVISLSDDANSFLSIQIQPADDVSPGDLVALWTSEEFIDDSEIDETAPDEVLLSASGRDIGSVVLRADLEDDTELVIIREAQLLDDGETIAIIQFFQTVEEFEPALISAQEGIEVDGEPVLAVFDPEDVAAEFE